MSARIMLVGFTVVAFMAVGCGQKREGQVTSGTAETPGSGPVALAGHSPQEQATLTETGTRLESAQSGEAPRDAAIDAAVAESLPPEIDATVSEEPVLPGSVIEISAVGSSDVTEMTVTDSRGKTYPMTRIEETGAWRVFYRMPMKVDRDRVALSVTGRNGVNQWKRVWVFPKVMREEATADSSGC
ncbi:MAG TPA: hypothetical protein VFP58_00570 [Candidatus Eisenbacteria bacterium]|nr:hypothetical protein [Candidatus Eisenbacteria bacterium]